jgi:hypothetical protein
MGFVAGDDEVRARTALVEMQTRIARGPYDALGLASSASPEQVRAAFLALTKRFHPARFARWSPDVSRLANEVFLGIKSAHDQLLRALGAPNARGAAYQTGPMPTLSASASGPVRRQSGVYAAARPPGTQATPVPRATGSESMPAQRPTPTSMTAQRPTPTATPRPIPPSGSGPIARASATPPPRTTPPPPQNFSMGTVRYAGTPPTKPPPVVSQAGAAEWDERRALQAAIDMLTARDWSRAKVALHALAARVPQSRQYRALLSYARGRELEAAGKRDNAATEYERALQLDPTLGQAKLALADLKRK